MVPIAQSKPLATPSREMREYLFSNFRGWSIRTKSFLSRSGQPPLSHYIDKQKIRLNSPHKNSSRSFVFPTPAGMDPVSAFFGPVSCQNDSSGSREKRRTSGDEVGTAPPLQRPRSLHCDAAASRGSRAQSHPRFRFYWIMFSFSPKLTSFGIIFFSPGLGS